MAGLIYRTHNVGPALEPWVESLWSLEGGADASSASPFLVVPDGRPEVIVHYRRPFVRWQRGGALEEESAFVFGQLIEPIELARRGPVGVVGARLRPHGLRLLDFGNASEATGTTTPLSDLGRDGSDLPARVKEASNPAERFHVLEQFLIRRAATCHDDRTVVSAAVDRVCQARGGTPISRIAESLGLSRRQLERQFRARVGISPKRFARLERFRAVLRSIHANPPSSWADLAVDFGYHDQSHLLRDFRCFAGRSASGYLAANTEISDSLSRSPPLPGDATVFP